MALRYVSVSVWINDVYHNMYLSVLTRVDIIQSL